MPWPRRLWGQTAPPARHPRRAQFLAPAVHRRSHSPALRRCQCGSPLGVPQLLPRVPEASQSGAFVSDKAREPAQALEETGISFGHIADVTK